MHRHKKHTEHGRQRLSGLEELGGGDGIVVGGVDWHVREGALEGVDNSTTGGVSSSHDD